MGGFIKAGAVGFLSATALAGLAAGVSAQDLPVVRFQAVGGSISAVPLLIMQQEKIDAANGFTGNYDFLGMSGGFQSFLVGNYEVSLDEESIGIAAARLQGFDVSIFFSNANLYLGIVVPGDSTATTPEDLVGKRVGHFGLDSGTTTFLRLLLEKAYGIDVATAYDLQQVGPAALVPMLESGDVEAIFNFEPHVSAAMVATDGSYLLQGTEGYRANFDGFSPWLSQYTAQVSWLKENPGLAYQVRDALIQATNRVIETNYEILREPYIRDALGVANEEVLEQLIENGQTYNYFTTEWTQESVDRGQAFLEQVAERGFLINEAPENVMVTLEELVGPRP